MLKTFHGSCHCGAVKFQADIDLAAGAGKCNCSICTKTRAWTVNLKPDAFKLLQGQDALSDYQFNTKQGHHVFCRTCGVRPFGYGHVAEIGGDFVAINLGALDDADPTELAEAPIHYSNGRDNDWEHAPAETRHL